MKKILVTGASGLVGSEFKTLLKDGVFLYKNDLNLENENDVKNYFQKNKNQFNTVIHLAAKVGGVKANSDFISSFFIHNIKMNMNIMEACHLHGLKLVSIMSTCVYPDFNFVNYPLTEDQLHNGPPHQSNFGYAYAKRMIDVQTRAYRKQFDSNFISVIPNNLYGLNDNFDLEAGHVIPALIRRFYECMINGSNEMVVWGSGKPLREFTFARDAAKIILWLSQNYNSEEPINIGNTQQISIKDLVEIIAEEIGFNGKIIFDSSKPDGQYEKPSSNQKLKNLGWNEEYTDLRTGLKETINHFKLSYPKIRGVNL